MAFVGFGGLSGSAGQAELLNAQVADQKKAQAVMSAIKTGAPIPAWVGKPPQAQGGFNQFTQAVKLYEQVHGQVRFENPQPSPNQQVGRPGSQFSFQQAGMMMSMLSQIMQAMSSLGGGFSSFMGGSPVGPGQTPGGYGGPATGGYGAPAPGGYGGGGYGGYAPQVTSYQPAPAPAPKPPVKKGGYA